jgi:hypothetical protein
VSSSAAKTLPGEVESQPETVRPEAQIMSLPSPQLSSQTPGMVARYFLRRVALIRRKYPKNQPIAQFVRAVMETILVFVSLPVVAIGSFFGILAVGHAPNPVVTVLESAPYACLGALVALSFVLGYLLLGNKFRVYRYDRSAHLQFDSASDRDIIFWQKVSVTVVCFVVIPLLAIYIAFGDQGLINAFK